MTLANRILGAAFLVAGSLHFLRPRVYEAIMPDYLPAHSELVSASGVAELAGGAAVLSRSTRRAGGWWLIATMVGVFPVHVHMLQNTDRYASVPEWALWARLPLQAVIIAVIHRVAVRR